MKTITLDLPYRGKHRLYYLFRRYNHPELLNPYIVDIVADELRNCMTVYDPFAGVGTTILLAFRGHYIVLGELEEYFVKAAHEIAKYLGLLRQTDIVQQDSTMVRISVDCVFTSPPFLTLNRSGGIYEKGYWRNGKPIDTEPPFRHARIYSLNPANLSNMKDSRYWTMWARLVSRVNTDKWVIHGKDIVREGQIVETWKNYIMPLLDKYRPTKRFILKKSKREISFWQRLMQKRGLPIVDYEWVVVLEKK